MRSYRVTSTGRSDAGSHGMWAPSRTPPVYGARSFTVVPRGPRVFTSTNRPPVST
ncbi:hypothetical protein [Dactylosporangium maewongense]|uniref:hypothetical protein n=1 Tax=Dactylosporangium maewongense TaxID=634393 RepID=UPI0031D928B7